jgi:hypothetical protein
MHTYYIERVGLSGESGVDKIETSSLSMALNIAEMMHGSLFTYKSAGSEGTPDEHNDPYGNAILRLKPDRQKVYRDRHHRALQNARRPQ